MATTPEQRLHGDVPTVAVVDSRNLFHQAGDVLGLASLPTVEGVIGGLAMYGFDVRAVYIGLALARQRDRGKLATQDEANRRYRSDVLAHPSGRALEGELHLREGGRVEEKIVDVACAVCITERATEIAAKETDARAIVVLSKDIDLTPAYDSAARRGVPLFVAAASVVDKRSHPYLLLGDRAMSVICAATAQPLGHRLRDAVAVVAKGRGRATWTVQDYDRDRRAHRLRHPGGALGTLPARRPDELAAGTTLDLYATGVDFGGGSRSFPYVLCGGTKPKGSSDLRTGEVIGRRGPHELEVRLAGGRTARVRCEIGHLVPGTEVLLSSTDAVRMVGALSAPPRLRGGHDLVDTSQPLVVTPVSVNAAGWAIARDDKGRRLLLLASRTARPIVGRRQVAVVIDAQAKKPARLVAQAISSPLPEDR